VQNVSPESPEARRKRLAKARARLGKSFQKVKPGTRPFEVMKRVAVGVYSDGFIHAGNLAYLALLTIFPFVIVAAAVARIFGQTEGGVQSMLAVLQTLPPDVADVLRKPLQDVLSARSGNLLWLGALVGLWTTGSFVETIRDVIRRAYGVPYSRPFWEYRLGSLGMIFASVFLILIAFAFSVFLSSAEQFVAANLPGGEEIARIFTLVRFAPALILFGSLYLLFRYLTPKRYRGRQCHKWPGPLWSRSGGWRPRRSCRGFCPAWQLRSDLRQPGRRDHRLVLLLRHRLGVSVGAQLNAALAEPPEPTVKDVAEAEAEEAAEAAAEAAKAEAVANQEDDE
jgi:membrane protein